MKTTPTVLVMRSHFVVHTFINLFVKDYIGEPILRRDSLAFKHSHFMTIDKIVC